MKPETPQSGPISLEAKHSGVRECDPASSSVCLCWVGGCALIGPYLLGMSKKKGMLSDVFVYARYFRGYVFMKWVCRAHPKIRPL